MSSLILYKNPANISLSLGSPSQRRRRRLRSSQPALRRAVQLFDHLREIFYICYLTFPSLLSSEIFFWSFKSEAIGVRRELIRDFYLFKDGIVLSHTTIRAGRCYTFPWSYFYVFVQLNEVLKYSRVRRLQFSTRLFDPCVLDKICMHYAQHLPPDCGEPPNEMSAGSAFLVSQYFLNKKA